MKMTHGQVIGGFVGGKILATPPHFVAASGIILRGGSG